MNLNQVFDIKQIEELFCAKMKYGQLFLFKAQDIFVVSRPLTVLESETIVQLSTCLNETAIEDWVFKTCFVISNKELDYLLNKSRYRLITYVSNQILLKSNIQEEEEYKQKVLVNRDKISTLQNVVEILISKAFGAYTSGDVKNMTQAKQFELLAKSEVITQEHLDLGDKGRNKAALRRFSEGATVIGGEDITSPEAADKPEF